jgi:hypothetical protein
MPVKRQGICLGIVLKGRRKKGVDKLTFTKIKEGMLR